MIKATRTKLPNTLLCFSHLRWGFVYQRPQHLLSRFARQKSVFYFEEPVYDTELPFLENRLCVESGVHVMVPHLRSGLSPAAETAICRAIVDQFMRTEITGEYCAWYYTPMALAFTGHLRPRLTVYDCMDELSLFRGAPPDLTQREAELLEKADIVFTGGQSLFEAKRGRHDNLHAFPSSIDYAHFAKARTAGSDPIDQSGVARPRIGYAGVIDERMDIDLLRELASRRPDWQFILLGPTVKIDPESLPKLPNIHLLGGKKYSELPEYMAGWDVAMLPFAHNDSTRFISPTKTPEYLAAGLPVISTSITDVVRPYGTLKLVTIGDTVQEWEIGIEKALLERTDVERRARVDAFLRQNSWDITWLRITTVMAEVLQRADAQVAASAGAATAMPMPSRTSGD